MVLAAGWLSQSTSGQTYDTNNIVVSTFVGYGFPAYIDGQGIFSAFNAPSQVVSDTASNLYVWDSNNARIRKVTPDGTVSTYAGNGTFFEGYRTNISLSWGQVSALAMDRTDRIWIVMSGNYGGTTYLLAISTNGYVSIENGGLTNLNASSGICFDSGNNLYYSGGNRIYRYSLGSATVTPIAGNGVADYFDGQGALFTAFNNPGAMACDPADNLYVWDAGNRRLRRIDPGQNVTTVAGNGGYYYPEDGVGTNAGFSSVSSLFYDRAGNLYFVSGSCVRRMDAKTNVTTVAGAFYPNGYADGPGNEARFNNAGGGCFSYGMIYVADSGNHRIRAIAANPQGQPVAPASLQLKTFPGLQITGVIGRTYQIQSSPNLNTWTTVGTVLLNSSPYVWVDQNPVSGSKYYRAVLMP